MSNIEYILADFFNISFSITKDNKFVFFICSFLFLTAFLRFIFWKISPVIYEFALIGIFYGVGKLISMADLSSVLETAGDMVSMNTLHFLIPIYVFTATFQFNTAFGSYLWMFLLLISLAPFFIVNLVFISWIMFIVFEKNLLIGFVEMLMITVIMSPIQVQYILDYLDQAQGYTAEFRFKMRAEQYSSIWLSFVISAIGILIGILFAKLVKYPLLKAAEMPPIFSVAITLSSVYLVQSVCVILGTSYTLAVGVYGIAVNAVVSRSNHLNMEFFDEYWQLILFITNSLTVALIGAILGYAEHEKSLLSLKIVIIYYCVFTAVRLVLLIIAFPLVTLAMGRTVEWRYAMIQAIGSYKGGPTYILGFKYALLETRNWYTVLQVTVIFTMISQIFNVLMFPLLLRVLRMYEYSAARIANMNIAMADTNNCREKAIFALKMDKVFRDANWPVVEKITRLTHPYKRAMPETVRTNEEGKEEHQIRSVICPDCKTEILAQPTKREIEAMRIEARERILKSQQVSFHRQFETGALTVREYDYLSTIVEAEVGSPEPRLHPEKIKFRSNFTKLLIQLKRLLLWFSRLTAEVYHYIPQSPIRNWCFQISTEKTLRIIMAILTLFDTVMTIVQVTIYYTAPVTISGNDYIYSDINTSYALVVQKLHIFFYTLSLLEFTVIILGLGIDQYFSRNVNKIEAAAGIVLMSLEIGIYAENCLKAGTTLHPFKIPVVMLIKCTIILRLAKVYILIIAAVPKIIGSIDAILADEMMRNYELGKAYLVALNRTSALLNRIVYSEAVYTELMSEVDADRMSVTKEMGLIQKENPSIATTVKTRHAIRYVINSMEDCIKDMKEEGVIDMIEAEAVQDSLARNKATLRELLMISATPPEDILKNIPWLKDDQDNLSYLLMNAELTSYDYGDVLIHAGDDPVGIHLLVSGLLRSHYVPSTTTLQLCAKFGVLPNYDFFNNVKFDQSQETYVVSGSIIGEIGAVSGRRYDMTINCDTAVQVYYIPWEVIKQVVHESKDSRAILSRIWKSISLKVASNILQYNVVSFQGWAPEKLLMYLNRGFVPVIPDLIGIVVTSRVENIILIEGVVMDKLSRQVYTAPNYIPKGIHEIIFPEHPEWEYSTICDTRLLIIPASFSTEEELRGSGGIFRFKQKESKEEVEATHKKVGFDVDGTDIK